MRIKNTETIGLVPFVDGGSVFDDPYPTNFGDLLWAAGLGARYYTAVGPIRLDVAFPLTGRDSDDFLQFSVSIDRKGAVWGRRVSSRVDLGGGRFVKKKTTKQQRIQKSTE